MTDFVIFETEHFLARQSAECPIPGYLLVTPKQPILDFSEIFEEMAADLGRAVCLACRTVEEIIAPERVYVARFGEAHVEIHFHIFPRTRWLLDTYAKTVGASTGPISGPQLFDWTRDTFRGENGLEVPGITVSKAVREMRSFAELNR
jgi:diadenosine tetraphosphate (Ap4A) HIT family hydrolase